VGWLALERAFTRIVGPTSVLPFTGAAAAPTLVQPLVQLGGFGIRLLKSTP
jgi:hypothetical protein